MRFGAEDYRRCALERVEDAQALLEQARWVGGAYLGGRAVEAMLQALLRTGTSSNESGHDLPELLKQAGSIDLLRECDEDELYEPVNRIAAIWNNNLRFADDDRFRRHFKQIKVDRGVKGDVVKYWSKRLVEDCNEVVNRGELMWIRSSRN